MVQVTEEQEVRGEHALLASGILKKRPRGEADFMILGGIHLAPLFPAPCSSCHHCDHLLEQSLQFTSTQ